MAANKSTPWKLEYDKESGMVFLSVRKGGKRVGLFQTSGELVPKAGWIDTLYWDGKHHEVHDFAAFVCRAVNNYQEAIDALKALGTMPEPRGTYCFCRGGYDPFNMKHYGECLAAQKAIKDSRCTKP